jgi:hypothetical protein
MNEQEWAEHFARDVDGLPNRSRGTDTEPKPAEYQQAVELARTLITTDFSPESQVRATLRRRLLNGIGAREGWSRRKEHPMFTFFWRRHPALSLAAIALIALLVLILTAPGTLTAAAQGIEEFVQSVVVGENTSIEQISPAQQGGPASSTRRPPPAAPTVEQRGNFWIIRTAIGSFGGNVAPGHDASVRRVCTFGEVQAEASFKLRQPGYLPAGYSLREAMIAPVDMVFLFYAGPNGDLVVAETAVGEQPGGDAEHASAVAVGILTDQPIESVTVNGQPAGWVEGQSLIWEAGGISYHLGAWNLSLDEATRIAESLQ